VHLDAVRDNCSLQKHSALGREEDDKLEVFGAQQLYSTVFGAGAGQCGVIGLRPLRGCRMADFVGCIAG